MVGDALAPLGFDVIRGRDLGRRDPVEGRALLVLAACRDYPFPRLGTRTAPRRSRVPVLNPAPGLSHTFVGNAGDCAYVCSQNRGCRNHACDASTKRCTHDAAR
jgi:hypothetical protein